MKKQQMILKFIAVKTASVENQFESAYVTCRVMIGDEVNNANAIMVQNTSNVDAYIRASIVVNWMDEDGNVRGIAPVKAIDENGGDYAFTINHTAWEQDANTGFYYYKTEVKPNDTTAELLSNITVNGNKPDGYELSVEVIAEAIQADGVTDDTQTPAGQDAWFNPLSDCGRAILNAWGIAPFGN